MEESISKKQLKEFGVLIGFLFPIVLGFLIPIILGHGLRLWTLWIGIPFLIIGLLSPSLLFYPYKIWMVFGNFLGRINSHIILGLVFLFVVQPIACIMRLLGYDPLRIKKRGEKTYREKRLNDRIDLTRIF